MKILCVGNWRSDVGYAWWLMERFWEAIAIRYPGRVTISFPEIAGISQRLVNSGAEFIQHNFDLKSRETVEFVRDHSFCHLYLTDQAYYSAAYHNFRRSGVKSIILHDHTPGERTIPRGLKKLLKVGIGRTHRFTADAYIATSDLVMSRFTDCVCLPQAKCHLARNGIDLDGQYPPTDIRRELGLPSDSLIVVSSSRATKYKRIHHIIEAAAGLDAYFVHCGDGPDMAHFETLLRDRGLEDRFFFLGRRNDVLGIVAAADIAVHASAGEVGMSLSILEFMRAGLPIVVPNSPTVSQSLRHGTTGLLYSPGDVLDLREQLRMLIENPDARQRLGGAAALEVRQYDIRKTVAAVLGVFSSLEI